MHRNKKRSLPCVKHFHRPVILGQIIQPDEGCLKSTHCCDAGGRAISSCLVSLSTGNRILEVSDTVDDVISFYVMGVSWLLPRTLLIRQVSQVIPTQNLSKVEDSWRG